jgi:hypothetical protein
MECVSFVWLAIECSIDERSSARVSVVRVRRRDLGFGAASAFRPGASQLVCMKKSAQERDLLCRMATFRRIMVHTEHESRLIWC